MQENEFEKKLQQKMDRLQVQPTEEVWQRIEAQVAAKKRKRRGVVFFFILSGLVMAGLLLTDMAGVFKSKGSIAAGEIKTKEPGKHQPGLSPVSNTSNAVTEIKIKEQDKTGSSAVNNQSIAGKPLDDQPLTVTTHTNNNSGNSPYASAPALHNNKIAKTKLVKRGTKGTTKMSVVSTQPDEPADNTSDINTALLPEDKTNTVAVAGSEKDNANGPITNKTGSAATTATKEESLVETVKKETVKNENPAVTKNNSKEKSSIRKWGLLVMAAVGISETGSSYLSDKNYATDGLGSTPTNGSNSGNGATYPPSKTSAGISFMAGIQLYRNISAKSRLITGLQYQLFNTSIETGQAIPAGTPAFDAFAYGTQKKYHNHYHFISIPLTFSTRLFSIGQRDICFDAGLNYSRLLSANALNYNAGDRIYYKDESVFKKPQWGVSSAIKFNLLGKNKPAFYIGPEFYYSLTPLASSGIYSKAHSSFIGLRLQKDLKK